MRTTCKAEKKKENVGSEKMCSPPVQQKKYIKKGEKIEGFCYNRSSSSLSGFSIAYLQWKREEKMEEGKKKIEKGKEKMEKGKTKWKRGRKKQKREDK